MKVATISPGYVEQNRLLHARRTGYGTTAKRWAIKVENFCLENSFHTILDYGSGKGELKNLVESNLIKVFQYDPAMDIDERQNCDLLACIDVMEHIEPKYLQIVLLDLHWYCGKMAFFTISTRKAEKLLPNGENPHLIVANPDWWISKLSFYFKTMEVQVNREKGEFLYIGEKRIV